MNFVIFGWSYYPFASAEAYCTTRFASALARAGHSVHVVTAQRDVVGFDYRQLVHPRIKVTTIPQALADNAKINWRWLTVLEEKSADIAPCIIVLRGVLSEYEEPILITRTYPWLAIYVGWHCRRYATKWIAHFSDPMLNFRPWCRLAYLRLWSLKFWMRRAMRHADAISVTCKRVRWYYREQLGPCVDRAKFILATHIGDFKLSQLATQSDNLASSPVAIEQSKNPNNRTILHDGDIYGGRGLQILEAVRNLNEQGIAVDFIQGRKVGNEGERQKILSTPHCFILDENASEELRARAKAAQVSFVADFNTEGLSYSPFLMSKFVYQIYEDKPMVVLSKLESEKHDYCVRYPEAGLFFADMKEAGSLERAIKAALACDPKTIDRNRIRERFSEEHIAAEFIEQLECEDRELLKEKWIERV